MDAEAAVDARHDPFRAYEPRVAFDTLRYELGQSQFLDVLNSQAQRFEARRNLIQARYDLLVATASLKRSLGKDPLLPLSQVREPTPEAE